MLSLIGWLTSLTALSIVIYGCVFGLFLIYKSKKSNAKLLSYMGLMIMFGALPWLGVSCDFFTILLTGKNIDNTNGILGILGFVWAPPMVLLMMYIVAELLIPEKKQYILIIYLVLGIVFELFIILYPIGTFTFFYPATP